VLQDRQDLRDQQDRRVQQVRRVQWDLRDRLGRLDLQGLRAQQDQPDHRDLQDQ
jgi:hypothetical protein